MARSSHAGKHWQYSQIIISKDCSKNRWTIFSQKLRNGFGLSYLAFLSLLFLSIMALLLRSLPLLPQFWLFRWCNPQNRKPQPLKSPIANFETSISILFLFRRALVEIVHANQVWFVLGFLILIPISFFSPDKLGVTNGELAINPIFVFGIWGRSLGVFVFGGFLFGFGINFLYGFRKLRSL